jgi:hypothetical protein
MIRAGSAPERSVSARPSADSLVKLPEIRPESVICDWMKGADCTLPLSTTAMYAPTLAAVQLPNFCAPEGLRVKLIW